MRDWRLDPADIEDLAMAYEWLVTQPFVTPDRSGLFGTCVGGSFALMAATDARIRDRGGFVGAFSPHASMRTLARDIATATSLREGGREPWPVDPLTRKVYVQSLTAGLAPDEAARLREALAEPNGQVEVSTLPPERRDRLDAMSPLAYLPDLRASIIVLMHDHDDPVIPRAESLQLRDALADRPGLRYTELTMFKHLDPTKVQMRALPLLRELGRFYLALYPMFRCAAG